MQTIDLAKVHKAVSLDGGDQIVLFDMLSAGKEVSTEDIEHNVYRVTDTGDVKWRISFTVSTMSGRDPFTGIGFDEDDGLFHAFRFECTEFFVNIETGEATAYRLAK
jgi:hypothetical protein